MTTTEVTRVRQPKRPAIRVEPATPKKAGKRRRWRDRHVQRHVDGKNTYPRRPGRETHPFETTLDF